MLFRDSWQQTSQEYEVKELHFFFPKTLDSIPFHVQEKSFQIGISQHEAWMDFWRWILIQILNVSTVNSTLEVNTGE